MKNYRYDLISASVDYSIDVHPQVDMKRLGFKVVKSEPVPIADCWWFRAENIPDNLPGYLHEMSDDFRFSDEYDDNTEESLSPRKPPEYTQDGSLTDYGRYVRGLL